jgi:hypothetical protein
MLRRVSDDRYDHDSDEELREVRRVCEDSQRADERFGDEGGHQCCEAECDDGSTQGPAASFELTGGEKLPLAPERFASDRHSDDQKQCGKRK